jgi:hypothetical protein
MALSPPVKKDAAASGYCPLCQAEYVGAKEYCSDCNVKLKKF